MTESEVIAAVPKELFIAGAWRPARSGDRLAVEDPATGETLCEIADAGEVDALDALGAAHDAQAEWGVHPPRERGEILRRAFELISERHRAARDADEPGDGQVAASRRAAR